MIKKTGKSYYFLFLLPLFFLLHGYTENYPMVPVAASLLQLVKYLVATAIILVISFLVIRSWPSAVLLTFLIFCLHFFFGPIHDLLKSWIPSSFMVKYSFLLPFILVCLVLVTAHLRREKKDYPAFFRYLNLLLVVLVLIDLGSLVIKTRTSVSPKILDKEFIACDTCARPDVYLIVADGYAGKKELEDVFHFDNSAFEAQLRQRGFNIVDSSESNYNYTPFTIASMLSMDYLKDLEGKNRSINDRKICYTHINKNPVISFFKYNGYQFRNYSIFQFAGDPPYRSTTFYKTGIDLVTAQTFLSRIDRDIRFNLVTRWKIQSEIRKLSYYHLEVNQDIYQRTWKEIETPGSSPRFIYTHIEMPHYPYYFNSKGEPARLEDLQEEKKLNLNQYIQYLQYANKEYLKLIDHIFQHSKQPPVIIFMSDHGFREFANDSVDHRYHFMNMNAVYLPNKNYQGFYKGISTVNQFPVILNNQFHQRLSLRKDSTSLLTE
jgi:hypothetical protein